MKKRASGIKIPVFKYQIRQGLDYAKATHTDLCRNSCDRPGHYRDCVTEGAMLAKAYKALAAASREGVQMKTVHFVRFYYPGSFVSETSEREVESRDAPVDVPPRAYGYAFFDKTLAMNGKEKLWGPEKNTSGITYFGEVYDLERVKREMPGESILISNMECNGYKRVVVTKRGTFPLKDGDKVTAS